MQITREGGEAAEQQTGEGGRQECVGPVQLQRQLPVLLSLHGLRPQLPSLPSQVRDSLWVMRTHCYIFYAFPDSSLLSHLSSMSVTWTCSGPGKHWSDERGSVMMREGQWQDKCQAVIAVKCYNFTRLQYPQLFPIQILSFSPHSLRPQELNAANITPVITAWTHGGLDLHFKTFVSVNGFYNEDCRETRDVGIRIIVT